MILRFYGWAEEDIDKGYLSLEEIEDKLKDLAQLEPDYVKFR